MEINEYDGYDEVVVEGQTVDVYTVITNTGDIEATQDILLLKEGEVLDSREVSDLEPGGSRFLPPLQWHTEENEAGTHQLEIQSENDSVSVDVEVLDAEYLSLEDRNPGHGDTDVPVDTEIELVFDRPVHP